MKGLGAVAHLRFIAAQFVEQGANRARIIDRGIVDCCGQVTGRRWEIHFVDATDTMRCMIIRHTERAALQFCKSLNVEVVA